MIYYPVSGYLLTLFAAIIGFGHDVPFVKAMFFVLLFASVIMQFAYQERARKLDEIQANKTPH